MDFIFGRTARSWTLSLSVILIATACHSEGFYSSWFRVVLLGLWKLLSWFTGCLGCKNKILKICVNVNVSAVKTPWGKIKRTFFSPLCPRQQGEKWCLAGASLGNVSRNVEPLRFGRVSAELKSAKQGDIISKGRSHQGWSWAATDGFPVFPAVSCYHLHAHRWWGRGIELQQRRGSATQPAGDEVVEELLLNPLKLWCLCGRCLCCCINCIVRLYWSA